MKAFSGILLLATTAQLVGCYGLMGGRDPLAGFPFPGQAGGASGTAASASSGQEGQAAMGMQMQGMPGMMDPTAMMAKINFQQEVMKNPDLPEWYAQREKMALAIGDRSFDKGFDRVFDSMVTALANLGCRVSNMERASGYLTATSPSLPPALSESLKKDALAQYAQVKSYPPSVLAETAGIPDMGAMSERSGAGGLTLSMVKQGAAQTKVKLRFDTTFYPPRQQALYKLVWAEVDKQMFLDKALD